MKRFAKPSLIAAAAVALLGLAACASPVAPSIYTLQNEAGANGASTGAAATQGGPARFVDVAPIVLPERLRRRQIVLRTDATQMKVLEQERWSSALPDELHDAVSSGLQAKLGAVDVSQTGLAGSGRTVYRILIEFNRLDVQLGGQLNATVAWSVKEVNGDKGQVCLAQFSQPAGITVGAAVTAHQRMVGQLVDAIAASERAVEGGGAAQYCSAS
jgi:uncharacterized lipoprotein YmbA